MILHESVEEHLILISEGSEESVFHDDGGLLLSARALLNRTEQWVRLEKDAHFEKLVPCSETLFLDTVHIIWQESFQTKE